MPSDVAAVIGQYPTRLLQVRDLIFDLADKLDVGPLTETLKWGEPAYLTETTKAGSTVRLALKDGQPAVFFVCNSGLVEGFRADFPELSYLGRRGILLDERADDGLLELCISRALTFHRNKKRAKT